MVSMIWNKILSNGWRKLIKLNTGYLTLTLMILLEVVFCFYLFLQVKRNRLREGVSLYYMIVSVSKKLRGLQIPLLLTNL